MIVDNELNPVLGIDLGTTFSAIARWDGRGSRVYQTKTGEESLQSVIYVDPESEEVLVGKLAYAYGCTLYFVFALEVKGITVNTLLTINIAITNANPFLKSFI